MYAVGRCTTMCPNKERKLRTRANRLSVFEKSNLVGGNTGIVVVSDDDICVKEYARSAAGSVRPAEELRTPETLERTTNYLVSLLDITSHGYGWLATTNFVTDRLRAVRQDVIIQQLPWRNAVPILERTIRYHIYIRFVLHRKEIQDFDPALNDQLLRSYMGDLFEYYEVDEKMDSSDVAFPNMDEFQSYKTLLNLANPHAILEEIRIIAGRSSEIMLNFKSPQTRFEYAFMLFLSHHTGNYFRFFQLLSKIRFLESCCLLYQYTESRVAFLNVLSGVYHSKHFKFPISKLNDWLLFDTPGDSKAFLGYFKIPYDAEEGGIRFHEKNKYCLETDRDKQELAKKFSYMELIESKEGAAQDPVDIVQGISTW